MKISILGGGPGGLYFSILMKKASPGADITVHERNRPNDTFGWGVVFSDKTLGNFAAADPETHAEIERNFRHWDDIDIFFRGTKITSGGHGFCGIARVKLLNILQARAGALGVKQEFQREVSDPDELSGADLVVAADGLNSMTRKKYAEHFLPDIDTRKCRFTWLGTTRLFDAFTFALKETEWGWFNLHAYRFDENTSTFIVETPEQVWQKAGLERMEQDESIAFCERVFADVLDGHKLMSNARHLRGSAAWIKFPRVLCRKWHYRNIVLIGDAAHTAHFSIGSGTKLAMEDAIALAKTLSAETPAQREGDNAGSAGGINNARIERSTDQARVERALELYQAEREVEALKLQSSARNRMEWFENVERYAHMDPVQFSYTLLTGSQRIGHENLKVRDPGYVARVETWLAEKSGLPATPVPPMFTPFRLRGLALKNRVVVSPMAMYSAADGIAGEFHLVHLGARALGGAGLVFTEMSCVAANARITPGCAGLWNAAQAKAWTRIVEFVHRNSSAKIGLQLGHAGPKGSTQVGWEDADEPLAEGNWSLLAASAVRYGPKNQVPRAMNRKDMDRVREQFVRATRLGMEAGFDMIELHCAHGYLLSSFICPLTNRRTDGYGGSLENRLRFPLEIFQAIRSAWPQDRPISVRISAHDWAPGGNTPDDAVTIAGILKEAGADMVDVSSGQTTREANPVYGRMYQTPFADRIRNETGIATIAVGNIFEPDHVNSIIAAGRADLCAIARPHLADPAWTLHAAAQLGYHEAAWPQQYLSGKSQLERNLARAAQMAIQV